MKLRVSEIEDFLCVHQFAFWRASPSAAIPLIISLCRDELGLRVEKADFALVRELDRRRYGFSLRVPTVVLKICFYCLLVLISLYFCLFVSVIHGRSRRQLRCRPGLFLAKVRLFGTKIANHLFEGQRCSRTACTGRARGTVGGPSQSSAKKEVFAAHYLASLEQAATIHQELASERAAELLSLVNAHMTTPAA